MRPRTLASIGAVLLYLWCELFQASPFAFLQGEREAVVHPTACAAAEETEDGSAEDLARLFGPAKVAR